MSATGDKGFQVIKVDNEYIPENGRLIEAYETEREIIILGDPEPEPDGLSKEAMDVWYESCHNCDAMGCGTLTHVIYRIEKTTGELSK